MLAPNLTERDELTIALNKFHQDIKPPVEIYCDGACSGNPGPGGWGVIMRIEKAEFQFWGGEAATTNNRMEMMAAIQALEILPRSCMIDIYTDSQYLRDGMTAWMPKWKKNGWMTASKQPVKNKDLWEKLDQLMTQHQVLWHWVRGHAGDELNEKADSLARHAVIQQTMSGH